MIAGPELTDDRMVVLELLASQPGLLEQDLVLLERDLELGSRFVLDGLLRDAAGRAGLLFVTGATDEPDLVSRILDCDAWVRDNSFLLRRHLGRAGIDWDQPPRCLVVGHDVHPASVRKILAISGVEIDVFELRMLRVRGETFWAGVPRTGRPAPARGSGSGPEPAPVSIEHSEPGGQWNALIEAVRKIDREIFFEGDRYREDAVWRGRSLATFRVAGGLIRVEVADDEGSDSSPGREVLVHDDRSMRTAVDRVLRRYLHDHAAAVNEPGPNTGCEGRTAAPVHELAAGRLGAVRAGQGMRRDPDPPGFKPHVIRSS